MTAGLEEGAEIESVSTTELEERPRPEVHPLTLSVKALLKQWFLN